MKYFHLVLANFRRKRLRAVLTIGSFAVAIFLFALLALIHDAFYAGVDLAGADRLVTINRVSLIQPLPISYRDRIARIPGIRDITYFNWFGGVYQDEKNFFPQFVIDPENARRVYPELVITDDQWQAFLADRQGCVVGESLAKRFGWKLGDRIPIRGTIFPGAWEFNLRAIYTGLRPQDDTSQFWFQRKYLDEKAPQWIQGLVGWYVVRVENPDKSLEILRAIDNEFANSPWETRTDTEKGFAAGFAKQFGNIKVLIMTIGSVVLFTLLLVSGNTMAIAVRERAGELAVLKTVGFKDSAVLGLILTEALLIAGTGGVIGLLLAKAIPNPAQNLLPVWNLSPFWVTMGIAVTIVVGLLAGLIPAISAMRLRVVNALRRV